MEDDVTFLCRLSPRANWEKIVIIIYISLLLKEESAYQSNCKRYVQMAYSENLGPYQFDTLCRIFFPIFPGQGSKSLLFYPDYFFLAPFGCCSIFFHYKKNSIAVQQAEELMLQETVQKTPSMIAKQKTYYMATTVI